MKTRKKTNQYIMDDHPDSNNVLLFMKYSKCKTLNELINLPEESIVLLLERYIDSAKAKGLLSKKLQTIFYFFTVNNVKFCRSDGLLNVPPY